MIAKVFSVEVTCPSCGELHTKKSRDWFIDKSTPFLAGEGMTFIALVGKKLSSPCYLSNTVLWLGRWKSWRSGAW